MKDKKNALVKQDVNFLENPLWNVDRQSSSAIFEIATAQGKYKYKAMPDNVPDDTDALFLYYLLFTVQETGKRKLKFKTHNVLKQLNMQTGLKYYKRFLTSLTRWKDVSVEFEGTFYINQKEKNKNGQEVTIKRYVNKGFHILNYQYSQESENSKQEKKKETRKYEKHEFEVNFDDEFIQAIEDSGFIKYIDLKTFVALHSPLARRLYEWLPKQLISRDIFTARHDSFFLKMSVTCPNYPSDIERKLKTVITAIEKINKYDKKYDFSLVYELKKDYGGKYFLLTFGKTAKDETIHNELEKKEICQIPHNNIKPSIETSLTVPGTAPELVRQTIEECGIEAVTEIYNAFLNQLKKAQTGKGKKIDDPAAYYANSLRKRIGAKTSAQRQAAKDRQTLIEKQRQEKAQEVLKADKELQATKAERERLEGLIAALSEPERQELHKRALAAVEKLNPLFKINESMIKTEMLFSVEKLKAESPLILDNH